MDFNVNDYIPLASTFIWHFHSDISFLLFIPQPQYFTEFQWSLGGPITGLIFKTGLYGMFPLDGKDSKIPLVIDEHMGRRPDETFVVDDDRCFGCGACIALCPLDVLTLEQRVAVVDEPMCSHCELCIPSCPVEALLFVSR